MKIVSLFSGAGGMDLGFKNAGFEVIWANEFDRTIWETYEKNHDNHLDHRDIRGIMPFEIPDCDGIIGGPPCQSWSEAGSMRGIDDDRGKLFYEFIRIIREKQPKFFVAENVPGILLRKYKSVVKNIIDMFRECNYSVSINLINAQNYNVPQDRKRVFFVGFRNDLAVNYILPRPSEKQFSLKDAIWDLRKSVIESNDRNHHSKNYGVSNHEYYVGSYSSMFMSRNRVRGWDEPSYTIQAGGRHAPLHPQAPKMIYINENKRFIVK